MEPQDKNQNTGNPGDAPANEDLHEEGVDIVGTSMALDNEFSRPEEHSEVQKSNVDEQDPDMQSFSREVSLEDDQPAQPQTPPTPQSPQPPQTPPPEPQRQEQQQPPQAPTPTPIPTSMPQPAAQQPVRAEEKKPSIDNDPSIKQIRTFKMDAEEAVRNKNLSTADIAIAEAKKRDNGLVEQAAPARPSALRYIAILAAVIVILGGGWYYWFSSSQGPSISGGTTGSSAAPSVSINAFVPYARASVAVVGGTGAGLTVSDPIRSIADAISSANTSLDSVYALAPIANATSTKILDVNGLFSGTHIPNRLARSLAGPYMVGAYTYDAKHPFVILKDSYFQNAYAGMLDWEKDMRDDLLPLIRVAHPAAATITTADSDVFSDTVVSNIDTRVLKDRAGDTLLAYAFADNDTIVITTSEQSLKYLLEKLLSVRTIQ